jgi:RHS repeat-associated protein
MDGDAGTVTVASYTYDDMGAVTDKAIHNGSETTSYAYDFAGRQTDVSSPSFSYSLWFDKTPSGMSGGRHDGNLAHVTWGVSAADQKGYTFTYDNFGQMTLAKSLQPSGSSWTTNDKFAERGIANSSAPIIYDKNGNIQSLMRTDANGGQLHKLQYNYTNATNGNAISSVVVNGVTSNTFNYDANGNMVRDGMTGVEIGYNILDLPEKIFAGSSEVHYIYDAAGQKLATVAANGSLTYYRSVFTYAAVSATSSEQLVHVLQPEGLVQHEGSAWVYKYFKTDHVGSTRVLLAARGSTLQEEQRTDFYPFGMAHSALNNLQLNRYLYGGKEYQDQMLGSTVLGLYDFHARYYNPMLGRWFNQDPALQTTNPYLYCGNSPLMYVDPDGEIFWAPIIFAAFTSGSMNLTMNAHNIENLGDGLLYFGIGAAAGAAGGLAGAGVAAIMPAATGFLTGATAGLASGFSSGFVTGAGNSWMGGGSFRAGMMSGLGSGGMGALSGGLTGGLIGGLNSIGMGGNFFTGKGASLVVDNIATNQTPQASGPVLGKGMTYSNEYAASFSDINFPGQKKPTNLYADGTLLDGYTTTNGYVYNSKGGMVNGSTQWLLDSKEINMYLYRTAFTSPEQLQLTMGHEYVHVNLFAAGINADTDILLESHELTARSWQVGQASLLELDAAKYSYVAPEGYSASDFHFFGTKYFPEYKTNQIFKYISPFRYNFRY